MTDTRVNIVITTTPTEAEAVRMSRALVEEGLAACVQRLPISATYAWQGRIDESTEYLLIVKTLSTRSKDLDRRIHELSTYDVPEVVTLEAASVAAAYGEWIRVACRTRDPH